VGSCETAGVEARSSERRRSEPSATAALEFEQVVECRASAAAEDSAQSAGSKPPTGDTTAAMLFSSAADAHAPRGGPASETSRIRPDSFSLPSPVELESSEARTRRASSPPPAWESSRRCNAVSAAEV
jgi:hypothetical protein